ncbi:MAG: hypothetical protein ACON4Z_11870 [Planctomycetota bacterium]
MKLRSLGLTAMLCSALGAQGPTFVSTLPPLLELRAAQVPRLVEQWSTSRLGRLFEDEDARLAGELAVRFQSGRIARQTALRLALQQLPSTVDAPPHVVAGLYTLQPDELWRLFERPVEEVAAAEFTVSMPPENAVDSAPYFFRTMSCRPRYEGRWQQRFDQEAQARARSTMFTPVADARISSFPAHVFALPEGAAEVGLGGLLQQQWMLQLPSRFTYGNGVPAEVGRVDAAPTREDADLSATFHVGRWVEALRQTFGAVPPQLTLLGADKMERLRWSARFVGDLIYDVVQLDFVDGPLTGLPAFLETGETAPPAQGLPDGALAQFRARIELQDAYDALIAAEADLELPGAIFDPLLDALDGGLALGCCAPAPGGLIPRLYLTLGLKDPVAFAAWVDGLQAMLPPELSVKQVQYGDVKVSVLKIPDAPQGLQPAWCVVGDRLHVAESALSMRAFLKAQADGVVAMDVDGMAAPAGEGDVMASFDMRFDAAALYEAFYQRWLPLFELSGVSEMPAPVSRDDLPHPDVVAEHLGKGRGVVRRAARSMSLVQASASGGLELSALLFAWPTMLAQQTYDYMEDEAHLTVARTRLAAVHEALQRFEAREQRRPADLAELFTAEQLPDDALLLPADDLAEEVRLPDGRVLRSSFRYFPSGIELPRGRGSAFIQVVGGPVQNGLAAKTPALLIELRPHQFHRAMLLENGEVPDTYGDYGTTLSIDQLSAGDEKKR